MAPPGNYFNWGWRVSPLYRFIVLCHTSFHDLLSVKQALLFGTMPELNSVLNPCFWLELLCDNWLSEESGVFAFACSSSLEPRGANQPLLSSFRCFRWLWPIYCCSGGICASPANNRTQQRDSSLPPGLGIIAQRWPTLERDSHWDSRMGGHGVQI